MLYVPLGLAAAAGAGFYAMLQGLQDGSYDPRGVPSVLLGKTAPDFSLPALEGVGEVVINNEVVEGRAQPLYIYSDRRADDAVKGA